MPSETPIPTSGKPKQLPEKTSPEALDQKKNWIPSGEYNEGRPAYEKDTWFYRCVAVTLGLTIIGSIIAAYLLALDGKDVPDLFLALASGSVGALAGVLAGTSKGGNGS